MVFLLKMVRWIAEMLIIEEQGAFRCDRGCVDHIFILKQMREKRESYILV